MKRKTIWKRGVVIFGIVLLAGVVSYTIYNFADSSLKKKTAHLKSEIAQEIQKIKEKDEPAAIDELIPEEISDGENGALVYREAFDLMEENAEEQVYNLLEKASTMKCQFLKRKDYEEGAGILLPHLRHLRTCSRLLAIKAKLEAENGEIDKSLHTCLTGLKTAKAVSTEPILISQLVRNALDNIALVTLEDVLKKGKGTIDRYQSLIDEIRKEREDEITYFGLLGERIIFGMQEFPRLQRKMREEWMRMGKEERAKAFEELFGKGQPTKDLEDAFLKTPETFFDNQELCYLRTMAKMISLTKEPYWQVRGKSEEFSKELDMLPKEKAILTQMLVPALSRAYNQEARIDALLGDAEIALACYIYKAKHGEFPSSLKELTPGILPNLPLDPFTGKNYIYRKEREGFVVYSVGDNLKDDGGKWGKPNRYTGDFDIVFCGF